MRSAALAIQGGGQTTRDGLPLVNDSFYGDERLSSRHSDNGWSNRLLFSRENRLGTAQLINDRKSLDNDPSGDAA
jgi:hypothetical protein